MINMLAQTLNSRHVLDLIHHLIRSKRDAMHDVLMRWVLFTLMGSALFKDVWAQEVFDFPTAKPLTSAPASTHSKVSPARWPVLPLLTQYRGEEKEGVRYLSKRERARAQLLVSDGLMRGANRVLLNPDQRPSQDQPLTQFPEQPPQELAKAHGFAIYIMDDQGRLFVSFEAEPHKFHHSSLAAGRPVASAGEMIIFAGKLYAINNRSGHYRPPPIALERTLKVLTELGVNLSGVLIKRYGSDF